MKAVDAFLKKLRIKEKNPITFSITSERTFRPSSPYPYGFFLDITGSQQREFGQRVKNVYYHNTYVVIYKKREKDKNVHVYIGNEDDRLLQIEKQHAVMAQYLLVDVFHREFLYDDKLMAADIEKNLMEGLQAFYEEKYWEYMNLLKKDKSDWMKNK